MGQDFEKYYFKKQILSTLFLINIGVIEVLEMLQKF